MAVGAAVPGMLDYRRIPGHSAAKKIGAMHGIGNLCVVILFALSWLMRRDDPAHPETMAIVLSGTAVVLSIVTGWMGSLLAERVGVSASTTA